MSAPYTFDDFFASGRDESVSPFLTPASRSWGKNLALKINLLSALFLLSAFITSFFHPTVSHLLLTLVYFASGTPALLGAIEDLKNLDINIDVLMTLAALLSVVIGSEIEGALLLVLFEFSAALEGHVMQRTKSAISSLNKLSPRSAVVLAADGTPFERAIQEIAVGSLLLVKAGEIIPLDGVVVSGNSFVNLAHLTGESAPLPKKIGDELPAGGLNLDGTLTMRVLRTSSDSTLTRIIELITKAQSSKPKLQRFLDRFGKYYASTIILLAFLFAIGLPLILSIPYLGAEGGIYRALTFLIAASPCALIIATPTAYLSAMSSCAKKGIILKGGIVLDALARAQIIAFDKTGTLTTGNLSCQGVEALAPSSYTIQDALAIAAGLERNAVHPIGQAIISYAQIQNISPLAIEQFKASAGLGLQGVVTLRGKPLSVAIGHSSFVQLTEQARKQGFLSTYLRIADDFFVFHFTDTVRPKIAEMLKQLKESDHYRLTMLTGDHSDIAHLVAKEVGIDEVFADLRPEDKLERVETLSSQGGLAMIGDGINDAPALARATVGISLGKIASATAVDASDAIFLNDDLALLRWLLLKARKTMHIVKQNLTLALAVILFATTPALLGLVPLWIAVLLHEGGTVLVGFNSLRLLRK